MKLFGPLHLTLLAVTVALGIALSMLVRRQPAIAHPVRVALGLGLAVNELIWWVFRYSHEGFHPAFNLPLQLCDATVWATILACLTLAPAIVEFAYFAGIAGAGMALITPDLWSPWPSYPAIYFFLAHGGIVIGVAILIYGRIAPLRPGAVWRAFGILVAYAAAVGALDAVLKSNYMYLRAKPGNASLLDAMGPWPWYLAAGAALAPALFWLLAIPAKQKTSKRTSC